MEGKLLKILAPMEDVTDTVFRQILCDIGKPDIFFTEFMNVNGYCSEGKDVVAKRIYFEGIERPIIVQLWGNSPGNFASATKEIAETVKPDGIDINMGCSVRDVLKTGGGSALIQDRNLSGEIIDAVKENARNIPVSVKTRIGYDSVDYSWIGFLLSKKLAMLTVHGRLAKEGYSTPSRWGIFKKIKEIRDEISPNTLLIGNGDIKNEKEGNDLVIKYGLDGYMVGRGVLTNPWLFSGREDIPKKERVKTLKKHLKIFEKTYGENQNFNTQKKYIKAYINNFDDAGKIREELMNTSTLGEIKVKIARYGN
ncbi:MAG TPA: tRNA-dihydrouridine synthase family protein [Candidatus Dojkabacteria bacterium]|nr:tRNA-dihydrouridine synthase family protein [Candidatus Dojkabacteria bacterium]